MTDNNFCHVELMSRQPEEAKRFYHSIFPSWSFSEPADTEMDYRLLETGQPPGGGLMRLPHPDAPPAWHVYVAVPDIEATLARVRDLGGEVSVPRTPVPGHGAFAFFTDPEGARLGLWEVSESS